ncbi:uncharacterized protein METZ01_LOCUS499836, partial [marine metagenome]
HSQGGQPIAVSAWSLLGMKTAFIAALLRVTRHTPSGTPERAGRLDGLIRPRASPLRSSPMVANETR